MGQKSIFTLGAVPFVTESLNEERKGKRYCADHGVGVCH